MSGSLQCTARMTWSPMACCRAIDGGCGPHQPRLLGRPLQTRTARDRRGRSWRALAPRAGRWHQAPNAAPSAGDTTAAGPTQQRARSWPPDRPQQTSGSGPAAGTLGSPRTPWAPWTRRGGCSRRERQWTTSRRHCPWRVRATCCPRRTRPCARSQTTPAVCMACSRRCARPRSLAASRSRTVQGRRGRSPQRQTC